MFLFSHDFQQVKTNWPTLENFAFIKKKDNKWFFYLTYYISFFLFAIGTLYRVHTGFIMHRYIHINE